MLPPHQLDDTKFNLIFKMLDSNSSIIKKTYYQYITQFEHCKFWLFGLLSFERKIKWNELTSLFNNQNWKLTQIVSNWFQRVLPVVICDA